MPIRRQAITWSNTDPVHWHICAALGEDELNIRLYMCRYNGKFLSHYSDVIMGSIASQITSLTIVYSTVYSGTDQRKHQSSTSLAFVRGIHRRPVNSPHKGPVTRKMFPYDDVIMCHVSVSLTSLDGSRRPKQYKSSNNALKCLYKN